MRQNMILDDIAASARSRVEEEKRQSDPEAMALLAEAMDPNTDFPFEKALSAEGLSVICEVKRASPSAGLIAEDFPYLEIAKAYAKAGADAVSVLTEPVYFRGSADYLREIAAVVALPALRKDFTIDSHQIYEARVLGASAVLLICAILSDAQLKEFITLAHSLGLSAVCEVHDAVEVERALSARARIIGVNNRDLRNFDVDIETSIRLRESIPPGILFISESGIRGPEDVRRLKAARADAILVGESFMRASDKNAMMKALKRA
jgi:indole-3-glycerol phosphate synthase